MNSAFLIAISLFIFATAFSVSLDELIDEEFQAYKLTYKKNYKNVIEEMFRKKIFLENKLKIAQHNRKYLKGETTFAMALNQFSDLLHHEFVQRMNGLNKNDARNNRTGSSYISPNNLVLPDSVDWRQKGAVTPVKDQKECGSCWAFSSTGGLEGQEFRKTGKLVSLSEQNLVDCSTSQGNHGCAGGIMANAFDYIKANDGIDSEESYPYNANDNQCKYNPVNKAADDTGYVVLPEGDEKALKEAVAAVGPICVGIDASLESFMQYSHGIYFDDQCSSTFLDHGVLVVGYGTEKGHDYWIVKNSWAEDWGEHGYLRMSRNRNNNCGIATGAVYPLV